MKNSNQDKQQNFTLVPEFSCPFYTIAIKIDLRHSIPLPMGRVMLFNDKSLLN